MPALRADPLLLSDYKFNGNGVDDAANSADMSLSGISFINGALATPDSEAFYAAATIKALTYNSFTVALDFNPLSLSNNNTCILAGGPAYRWLILEGDDFANGHLIIRDGKGEKDRITMFPELLRDEPCDRIMRVLPNVPQLPLWLVSISTLLGSRLTGYVVPLFRYPYPGQPPMRWWNWPTSFK